MDQERLRTSGTGLEFPRDPSRAVLGAADYWSDVDRREMITSVFAIGAYSAPVTRWLVQPADTEVPRHHGQRVGSRDIAELWDAVSDAQRGDSKYGGGSWKATRAADCLAYRAAPLLRADCTETIGRQLFTVTAELARVAAWTDVDTGNHHRAQRHFVQALRLARAAANVEMGCYVLSTMALQTILRGHPGEAIDMAQGAYERAKGKAAPKVLGFAKLMEARAHAADGDAQAASTALAASETLIDRPHHGEEPPWIKIVTHARVAADATEMFRDLKNPKAALTWNARAHAMSPDAFTRSVGLRLTAAATAHLHARDLDQALAVGREAVHLISQVSSTRARGYVHDFTDALAPWQTEPAVIEFVRHAQEELAATR
ncbi:sporulation protein [Streptomyces niveus]|uniref:sporulation protein n=1 Tax=Streptomyces niveus TaxID=193462 RepID=UPI0036AF53F7